IQKTKEYTKAENFYETMLADCDEAEPLLNSPLADGPDTYSLDLNFNHESYKTFLNENGISENVLFTGVFAYTLSRFVGNNKALFNIIDNGRDRFDNYNAIGMFVNTLPLLVDCKNQNIRSFMDNTSNLVYNVMRYNYYPFRLLANKYNIDSNILFQFMPDWIKDDESINIYSNPIQDMNDLIADLSVGVIQKGDKYNLSITYSDKYSQEFIKSLASSYELILNGMLNTNSLSDINYTLSSDLDIMDAFNQNEKELKYADILMLLMIIL
ncbi:condensation domain-containing protein, partial [uncultured Methanobrevibacter sp.]|uniref:condensation domain-containing protein n=1 Tax=uncultured Methanobrevibacter sp. TaxID=253161 RepID=UPI0025EAAA4D